MKDKKILVAMSGGVDSSVAAALLVRAGYDVTGAFMINYDSETEGHGECWRPDYQDAVRVAAQLGIPLLKWDFVSDYKSSVLDYMLREYSEGRTPNPDVLCNTFVKFGAWLDRAKQEGFDVVATGHYAEIRNQKSEVRNQFELRVAKDGNKDQTYFLHQLNQEQLAHAVFPLGEYTKDEVRKMAKEFDLPTADKAESMGVCFIGKMSMTDFLKDKLAEEQKTGNIVKSGTGDVLGQHDGLLYYTIGQRHGFSQPGDDRPLYVLEKDAETNELVVGYEDDPLLMKREIGLTDVHWIGGEPAFPLDCTVRLRHRQALQRVEVRNQKSEISLIFDLPQRAVTPGQFAVFYKEGVCLGGGIIS